MAKKRKSLTKKVRFEVFKRDSFTCQYCGREAPDVILNVDHIKPVKEGGSNEMLNLITSCFECNSGKKAIPLSDDTAVKKQKAQMKILNAKREQSELMMKWRDELQSIESKELDYVEDILTTLTGYTFSDSGKKKLKAAIKKYNVIKVADALEKSIEHYVKYEDGEPTRDSVEHAIAMHRRILNSEKKVAEKPYLKDLYYIRGILRNRLNYIVDWKALKLLEKSYERGAEIEDLKTIAKECRNWIVFQQMILSEYEVSV